MSKLMRFRNSGKLDLGSKNVEYIMIGVVLVIIVAAVLLVVKPMQCGDDSSEPRGEYRVKCTKCGAEWPIEPKDVKLFHRDVEMDRRMGGVTIGADCEKCGEKECVFMMERCPECKKYYLSKRITDPDEFRKGGNREICPYCGTDLREYWKEHHKK